MKALRLPAAAAAIFALLALAPAGALAQVLPGGGLAGPLYPQPGSGSLYPTPIPPQGAVRGARGGFHRGGHGSFNNGFIFYEEPEVVHDVIVVHDQPAAAPEPAEQPSPPRERYVIGKSYDSLPGGCMKMVEGGASYFLCSGDWYREVGRALYKAVGSPL
jgi:hypothetical protein